MRSSREMCRYGDKKQNSGVPPRVSALIQICQIPDDDLKIMKWNLALY